MFKNDFFVHRLQRESQAMAQQYKELSDKLHKSDGRLNSLNLELRRSEEERNGCVAELKSKEAQLNVIGVFHYIIGQFSAKNGPLNLLPCQTE